MPFTVLGDPDFEKSIEVIRTYVEGGADYLELGLPFSDPPADGPVIQAAHERALAGGMTTRRCFELIGRVREFTTVPIGLLVYYNLILSFGVEAFYVACRENGVNSVLIADLPLEHLAEVSAVAKKNGILLVYIVSELTDEERLKAILEYADGYLYLVSYLGVTGNEAGEDRVKEVIARVRKLSEIPIYVGFGINEPEQARKVLANGANGFIVGSRLVREIPDLAKIKFLTREFHEATK